MNVKHIVKTSAAIAASLLLIHGAEAATPGAYAGLGLGEGKLDTASNSKLFPMQDGKASTERYGIAGKLFGGYNFNPYLGLEASYQAYTNSVNKFTAHAGNSNAKIERGVHALNLVGKAYLPLQQFDLYALAGFSETFNSTKVNLTNFDEDPHYKASTSFSSLRPIMGIGADYNVSSHLTTGLELSRIQGKGNLNTSGKAVPSANLLSLTAAYNFG